MIDIFISLDEFRQHPLFKTSHPFLRKAIVNIGKAYDCTFSYINTLVIRIPALSNYCIINGFEIITKQDIYLNNLLFKISQYGWCLSYRCDDLFILSKYTKRISNRNPEFIYHMTDVEPDLILNEGLKKHYSLSSCKPHPSLVFASEIPMWFGKYTYKIATQKQLYIDTNLDWQCRDRGIFAIYDEIRCDEIVEYSVNYDRDIT